MGRRKKIDIEAEKRSQEQNQEVEVKKKKIIDISVLKNSLILFVDPPKKNIVQECYQKIGYVDIRESFYKNYLPSRIPIPKYPYRITDGFVRKLINICTDILDPNYKFNSARVAVSKYHGRILNDEGDFYSLVDDILKTYLKEFFTFTLNFPEDIPCVVGGVRYQFEVEYLRLKFKNRPIISVGIEGSCPGWVDKQIKKDEDFLEALCA